MSKATKAINQIQKDLDSVSGLDGVVGDFMEILQKDIHSKVVFIKNNFPEANVFDYYGIPKDSK